MDYLSKEKTVCTIDDLIVGMTKKGVLDQYEDYESVGKEIIE